MPPRSGFSCCCERLLPRMAEGGTASFRTEWQPQPEHGVLVDDSDPRCATQTDELTYVWSAAALPSSGCVYWELE